MERTLTIMGLAIVAVGILWPWLAKLGLAHLPGDIYIQSEHGSFYFPITTCILVRRAVARHLANQPLTAATATGYWISVLNPKRRCREWNDYLGIMFFV